ncbi:MAG TPA: M28 family peptidase [Saprospiraceae bacterium]|nr:M28 family peptidase [Saprospiraceae bacterium]
MRIKFLIFFLLTAFALNVKSQYTTGIHYPDSTKMVITDTTDLSVKYAKLVTTDLLRKHLTYLASDELEGRETGTKGNNLASNYLKKEMMDMGLRAPQKTASYFQDVKFTFSKWLDTDIFVNEKRFKHLWDYLSFPEMNQSRPVLNTDEVLYLGYGIDDEKYSDYNKVKEKELQGKVIMINKGEPMNKDSIYWISGTRQASEWSQDINKKLEVAFQKGVALVLIIEEDIKTLLNDNRRKLIGAQVSMEDTTSDTVTIANSCFISSTVAREIIGKKEKDVIKAREKINEKGKNKRVNLKTDLVVNQFKEVDVISSKNVIGFIPGDEKPDEYIVVSAHYDHLGKKGDDIYNGADDNGSGTSSVLTLANAFSQADKDRVHFKRNIVFLLVTGEEKGLLGSEFYTHHPIIPLENTVADVNIDMVGRVDDKYQHNPNYIYVIGSDRISQKLHDMNEADNQKYSQLVLDYTYNDEADPNRYYYRSDHYNFAKNGIPSVFFFNGTHADYHRPTDTVDKINFEKMEKVDRHIFHLIWSLAMMDGNLK